MARLAPPLDLHPLDHPGEQHADSAASEHYPSDHPMGMTSIPNRSGALTLVDALDQWLVYLRGSDRIGSPRTIDAYLYGMGKLVAALPALQRLEDIEALDIERLVADLKVRGMSPAGRLAVYRPIRTFFTWCVKRGMIASSPIIGVEPPKVKVQPVEFVTEAEWAAILATTATRSRWAFRERRDLAILLILGTTGARLSEVAGLTLLDIDVEAQQLLVHGKGGKDRLLPLLPADRSALTCYLDLERPRSPYSTLSPELWLASKGPMTANGIAQMVAERGKQAGIARRVHPHEFRHRFVSQRLADGMPDALVMALTGHTTPSMLQRYGAFNRAADAMQMYRAMAAKRG